MWSMATSAVCAGACRKNVWEPSSSHSHPFQATAKLQVPCVGLSAREIEARVVVEERKWKVTISAHEGPAVDRRGVYAGS
jgi:hypothetical protein